MTENNKTNSNNYAMESRSYKTRGRSYKDRYLKDVICSECGGNSVYKDDWGSTASYKCLKRDCRHNWFVHKTKEEMRTEKEAKKEEALEAENT